MSRFADLYLQSAKQIDILGSWIKNEDLIMNKLSCKRVPLLCIEPWFAKHPWSSSLSNKKILVVHPFAETIKKQYDNRSSLFENPEVLPTFASLHVIKAVQSIAGEECGFSTWFDALEYMINEIDKIDYDIALIGCGAYGMPLAAHCKAMGKKAIHLGGALQLLFGIKGRRWETEYDENYKKMLNNQYWVRPSELERPHDATKVENGCYW